MEANEKVAVYCMWIRGLCELDDLEHAVILARRAAQEFPREPDLLVALGNVLDLVGQLDEAREAFSWAVEVEPRGVLQRYNLGAVLERLGSESEAEECYRQAQITSEGTAMLEAHGALGALLRRQGRLDEASDIYEAYLNEDPLHVEMLVEHGICLSDLDRLETALDRFDLALSLEPGHPGAHYNRAITLYRRGLYRESVEGMRDALACDPDNPLTLAVLGSWLLSEEEPDLDQALGHIYRALETLLDMSKLDINPGYASLVMEELFEALWQNGRPSEAREIARVAGSRDWVTPHVLQTLNRADHGMHAPAQAYIVKAMVELTNCEHPDWWPADASGYEVELAVVAEDEDEARAYTLDYLQNLEPQTPARVMDVTRTARAMDETVQRSRGVMDMSRSYTRARK